MRTWLRLIRRPGHTATHLALFTVVASLMLSGLMIQGAAAQSVVAASAQVGAVATMSFDINGYIAKSPEGLEGDGGREGNYLDPSSSMLDTNAIEQLCELAIVTSCDYGTQSGAFPSDSLQLYSPTGGDAAQDPGTDLFQVQGVRDLEVVSPFRSGDAEILAGDPLTPASAPDEIIIDARLAEQNGLEVGDAVDLYVGQLPGAGGSVDDTPHRFRISGIYESSSSDAPAGSPAMLQPANMIYASVYAATLLLGAGSGGSVQSATFTLADPDALAELRAAGADLGIDPEVFPLTVNDKLYRQLVGPLEQTATFANAVVWASLIAGCLILALIVASSLRARRREVGVLLSLGETKPRVLGQQFLELAACAVLGVLISVGLSAFLAPALGSSLLAGQVAGAQDQQMTSERDYSNVGGGVITEEAVDPIDSIDVAIDPAGIGLVTGAVLGITAIAIALPGVRLARQHPRDILKNGA
jgi:putative ABC transport system permease protein